MSWEMVLLDRQGTEIGEVHGGGNQVGEVIRAYDRSFKWSLSTPFSASFSVRRDHPLLTDLLQLDMRLLKVTQDKGLRVVGPLTTYDKKASGGQGDRAVFASSDAAWRLGHRLIGKSAAGYSKGTALAPVDRGAIAVDMLTVLNAESDTGIRAGSITASYPTFVGPWQYKPASEALTELASGLDGFEWRIDPVNPVADATGVQIGALTVAPVLGQPRSEVIFEYGCGKHNVAEFTDQGDANGRANRVFVLPDGFPDQTTSAVQRADDTASQAAAGLYEDVVPTDLSVDALRLQLAQDHVAIRRIPRRVVQFTPTRDLTYVFGTDYIPGDLVIFRAQEEGVVTVNGSFRIYAVEIKVDDNGTETPTLTLIAEDT